MSWIGDPDEADTAVTAAYERDRAAMGYVANYTRVFAHRPAVLEAWRGLNGAVKAGMDPRRYELATARCRAAAALQLLLRWRTARSWPSSSTARTRSPPSPPTRRRAPLSAVDRAVMTLAGKVAAGAAAMTEDDLAELLGLGLTDADVLDVVLAAAARCFFSSVLDAVGAEPDPAYRALAPDVQAALTVGRPIQQATGTG